MHQHVNKVFRRMMGREGEEHRAEIFNGASLGAGVICVGPVSIGEWAFVAAGAVVTRDVGRYELVAGVPAQKIGWVGQAGFRLNEINPSTFVCPSSGQTYLLD